MSDDIDVKEIEKAYKNRNVFAAKLYPAGATTNASKGVKNFEKIYHIFEKTGGQSFNVTATPLTAMGPDKQFGITWVKKL